VRQLAERIGERIGAQIEAVRTNKQGKVVDLKKGRRA
jgi:hypothetical protein